VMGNELSIEQLNPALRSLTGYQGEDLKGAAVYKLDAGLSRSQNILKCITNRPSKSLKPFELSSQCWCLSQLLMGSKALTMRLYLWFPSRQSTKSGNDKDLAPQLGLCSPF